jgi:hypothetical protein
MAFWPYYPHWLYSSKVLNLPIWLREQVYETNKNEYDVTDDENYDDSEYTEIQEINTPLQIIGESPIRKDIEVG